MDGKIQFLISAFFFLLYQNQVCQVCPTYKSDTGGIPDSGFSSEGEDYSVTTVRPLLSGHLLSGHPLLSRRVSFTGHIPQVTVTGH